MTREAKYLIECVSAVMHKTPTPNPPEGLDWKAIVRLAAQQSVANILCYAVEGMDLPSEVQEKLQELKKKAILREATQEMELRAVRKLFSELGIRFMPLKGVHLKTLYPRPDLRVMGDIDILFDEEHRKTVHDCLCARGYSAVEYEIGVTDVYQKPPIMNLEMHTVLVDHPKRWREHFSRIWEDATALDSYEYVMSKEDYYVFFMAHLVKHYAGCGTGIRSVLDLWVCRHNIAFDEAKVNARFEELGISEFVGNIEALAEMWFGEGNSTPLLEEMAEYIVSSATYGERANSVLVNTKAVDAAKREYFMRRVFPPREMMQILFPILEQVPALLPVCWVLRWGKTMFKSKTVRQELQLLGKLDNDQAAILQDFHRRAGLFETYSE